MSSSADPLPRSDLASVAASVAPVLAVDRLVKRYGALTAVDGISFSVAPGEIFGLLGPNGAGKTTTVEILEGLRESDGGSVRVLGLDPRADAAALKQRIGVQLQTPTLFPRLSVAELLRLFSTFYQRHADLDALISGFGLEESRAKLVKRLSGGQQQRLSVALALVNQPDLIFLDEPTAGLDPQARINLWDVVRAERDRGATVLLTTHYLDEAERLCDRVAILEAGQIVALAPPRELVRQAFSETAIVFRNEAAAREPLLALPAVREARAEGPDWTVYTADVQTTMRALLALAADQALLLEGLSVREASLEDAYLKLTGRRFRD
jgi:ABC-2 type transport system ATP-binding protein